MASKSKAYAILEGIQLEMYRDKTLTLLYEYQRPVAASPGGKVINLFEEFGPPRVADWGPLDEVWYAGGSAGMAMTGVPCIGHLPSMTTLFAMELTFNQIGKLRYMTGGQASMPLVLWFDGAGRAAGSAGQHTDVGQESLFAALPGVKVVIPSNAYDAKGLMIAAIRDSDPVLFFDYADVSFAPPVDVPDEPYEVKIGEAAIREKGTDITIVGFAPATIEINKAIPMLKKEGISAEYIDPRTLKPLPIDTIVASVKKTGRLLCVDHGHDTLGDGTEIVARVAQAVRGARFGRIAFPDAPGPGARTMMEWMKPDAPKIVAAAKKLLSA